MTLNISVSRTAALGDEYIAFQEGLSWLWDHAFLLHLPQGSACLGFRGEIKPSHLFKALNIYRQTGLTRLVDSI